MENTSEEKTKVEESTESAEEMSEEASNELKANSDEESSSKVEEAVEEAAVEAKDEFKEKYYYLAAEMQNMQRRFDKEKENLLKFGSEKIMNDLVSVVDNFERTLGFIEKEEDEKIKNIAEGIRMVSKLFVDTLEKHGLKRIEALGEEFDPNFHEALAQQPAEGKKDMEVIQVFENGYTLNDRVVRAAKVIVAKN